MKRKSVRSSLSDLELPYSHSLLSKHGLIPLHTSAMDVVKVTQKLIRIPVIAKRRAMGLPVERILEQMPKRSLASIRAKLRRVRK